MATELTGTYTYRSFHNRPEPVDDFNQLRFGQLELRLAVDAGDQVTGLLVFPSAPGTEPLVMDVSGRTWAGPPERLTFTWRGRSNTPIADFHYEYDGFVLPQWEAGVGQRVTVAGTVLRAADHGSGATLARAGYTASFLAVRRDA